MVVFEWWILKVVVIVVGLLRMIVLIGGSWFYCFSDLWFWFHCNFSAFSTSVSAFFLYFFRSLFFSNSISIYSSNGSVNMFATLYELSNSSSIVKLYSVRNLYHVINFFKLSLFKFDFSVSKSYVIALQLEKNQHSFNAP
jgi:hypothetical protein